MKSNKENSKVDEERRERARSSYSELPETESSPSKVVKKERKGKENRELRLLRRSKTLKEKNDPNRFAGDGINFKAKIIGIESVLDARGNRMCQGALQRLKAAVKTSGDHKQRIILNISLNGIMIKDEKSGETLHHHPIHKISFISQDTNDNRAFGYVFGCPQTGHEFFGIKTEKIASHVVLTLRDLFLTALELKKKEIESAMESQNEKETADSDTNYQDNKMETNGVADGVAGSSAMCMQNGSSRVKEFQHDFLYSNIVSLPEESPENGHAATASATEPVTDTLLDLQFTMDSLQQGISQMDHTIASAASQNLGLSFSEDDISECSGSSVPTSFHYKLDKLSSLYQETLSLSSRSSSTSDYAFNNESRSEIAETSNGIFSAITKLATISNQSIGTPPTENGSSTPTFSIISQSNTSAVSNPVEDRYAVFQDIDALPSIFDNPVSMPSTTVLEPELNFKSQDSIQESDSSFSNDIKTSTPVVFAELDPLGNHPYVDKKDFFQELKNPPKKVLKDLVGDSDSSFNDAFVNDTDAFIQSNDITAEKTNCEPSSVLADKQINPFTATTSIPPKLPPKRLPGTSQFSFFPDSEQFPPSSESSQCDVRNPFNPFAIGDYPDIPPPSSPPPPPPPRMPSKVGYEMPQKVAYEMPLSPPPRPPNRTSGIPTPPLPKRRSPFAVAQASWFSFDQDSLAYTQSVSEETEEVNDQFAPPLPSPARKLPPTTNANDISKSASASNSPLPLRRRSSQSPQLTASNDIVDSCKLGEGSPRPVCKILTRHSSLLKENDIFASVSKPISELAPLPELSSQTFASSHSPPLPPKPMTRPNINVDSGTSSSPASSNTSALESSNGTHSSSSLVFSSCSDSLRVGSSSEALFAETSEVFQESSLNGTQHQSPSAQTEEVYASSPDSIFRRKEDPFADEFFLTLPKKSSRTEKVKVAEHRFSSNFVKLEPPAQ